MQRLARYSAEHPAFSVMCLILGLAIGGFAVSRLPVDAMPDVSSIQVDIITKASGLSPPEVERTVTVPIEIAITGVPGSAQIRSVSRFGLSAVTVVFQDGTNPWFARQLVLERLRMVQDSLSPSASVPELGPVSTGLGTIYRFIVRSPHHAPMQLRTLIDWEIVPRLRSVPGVADVNTMGGELKQFQVHADIAKLNGHGMALRDVTDALRRNNLTVGGGYLSKASEAYAIRGEALLKSESDIENVVIRDKDGVPVLVKHVARVSVAPALRYGVVTHDGEEEAVSGIVMMLLGSNSRTVVHAVNDKIEEIQKTLPPGVALEEIYDRSKFVEKTLGTVFANLLEGVAVVTLLLTLLLGTWRGAVIVALGIPFSMAIALAFMLLFGVTGDIMSLGAIDFGFLVDGPVVLLEAMIAATTGAKLGRGARLDPYREAAVRVAKPVGFAVAIIMLVYLPLLSLEGVEGKMFRPMALTMASALFGALLYSVLVFPGLAVLAVPSREHHGGIGHRVLSVLGARAERLVAWSLAKSELALAVSLGFVVIAGIVFAMLGAEFVPRIFEGDAVVAMRRAPSISIEQARTLDLATEKVLHEFPEVVVALGQTGRAELAIDSVGLDNTDILVSLKPQSEWVSATDFDDLSEKIKTKIETRVPATFASVSQPIEDLTNQMIAGSRADVSIKIFGNDLDKLVGFSNEIGRIVGGIQGTGDLRIERILGQPIVNVKLNRAALARYGVAAEDALDVVVASREGIHVGDIYEGERRFQVRVLADIANLSVATLGNLYVEGQEDRNIPLREVADIEEIEGASVIKRQDRERIIRVDVNLRGRDLLSWVNEARAGVAANVKMPSGYRVEWGGQFENFERASARLALVIPSALVVIGMMLFLMFGRVGPALATFGLVPLAVGCGVFGLLFRGLPFSLPAAVGFIALGGVSVLNGVVIANDILKRANAGVPAIQAISAGFSHSFAAVVTTSAVAAFGFLPMALSTGIGSEVQRPLATVVVVGILGCFAFLFATFPALLLRVGLRQSAPGE